MNTKTTEEKIAVMQAFVAGRKIEYSARSGPRWYPVEDPIWNWHTMDYRIARLTFPIQIVRFNQQGFPGKPEVVNSVSELPVGETLRILPQ